MASTPLSPEKQAEIENLARAIHEAVDGEIRELAANLATTEDAHLFGENEFQIRALAHKIAAKAIEQHLAQKKTRMAKLTGNGPLPACPAGERVRRLEIDRVLSLGLWLLLDPCRLVRQVKEFPS